MYRIIIICISILMLMGCSRSADQVNSRSDDGASAVPADVETGADAKPGAMKEEAKAEHGKPAEGGAAAEDEDDGEALEQEQAAAEDEADQDDDDEDDSVPQDGTIEEKMASLKWAADSNDRFDFKIEYPSFLKPMRAPDNGDGREYKWKDVTYTAWGEWADGTVQEEFEQSVSFLGHAPKYKVVKENYYIISDFDGAGNIFYRKTVRKDDASISIQVTYPKAYKEAMDPIVKKIAAYKPN